MTVQDLPGAVVGVGGAAVGVLVGVGGTGVGVLVSVCVGVGGTGVEVGAAIVIVAVSLQILAVPEIVTWAVILDEPSALPVAAIM